MSQASCHSRPGEPHRTLAEEVGRLCPYCRSPLHEREQVVVCPACHLPHHLECWLDNGRCTTYGCGELAAPRLIRYLERVSDLPTYLRRPRQRRQPDEAFDMTGYVIVLALSWLFGILAVMLALDLLDYLREHAEVPAVRRRKLTVLAWCGIVIGLLQVAVLVACVIGFMVLLPTIIR